MIDNIDKLNFAIQTSNYSTKGSFRYKSYCPKKEDDTSAEYKLLKIKKDYIEIYNTKEIAKDVKVSFSEYEVSYSSRTEKIFEKSLTFDELTQSEYWEDIVKRYPFNEEKYKIYKRSAIYIDDNYIEMDIYSGCYGLNIRFDRYDGELSISSCQNEDANYIGKIHELVVMDNKQNYENIMNKKLINLMKNHKVEILSNGFVIDNTYYEDIEDFEEENK